MNISLDLKEFSTLRIFRDVLAIFIFDMEISPAFYGLKHFHGGRYFLGIIMWTLLCTLQDRYPHSKTNERFPNGGYLMHFWISDTDGNGYYVPVYFGNQVFTQGLDYGGWTIE